MTSRLVLSDFGGFPEISLFVYKVSFTLIYILIVYILLANKLIYKWPYQKPKFTNSTDFNL